MNNMKRAYFVIACMAIIAVAGPSSSAAEKHKTREWISIYDVALAPDGEPMRMTLNHVSATKDAAQRRSASLVDEFGGAKAVRKIAIIEIEYDEGEGL